MLIYPLHMSGPAKTADPNWPDDFRLFKECDELVVYSQSAWHAADHMTDSYYLHICTSYFLLILLAVQQQQLAYMDDGKSVYGQQHVVEFGL